jgi:hypothetical protein
MTFDEWKEEMEAVLKRITGCTWHELAGDLEPLEAAYKDEETPTEFANWWVDKHDLMRIA